MLGKQTRTPHKVLNSITTSHPLDLVHMDLVGPIQTLSLSGMKYVLVIVDDFTRFTWVRFLKDKSSTFKVFKSWCKLILNETSSSNSCIVRLRTDNGTEFKNDAFDKFCDEHGIKHEFSAAHTPQQNGIVERKNRVIIEMARVMLNAAKIASYFLGRSRE